MKQRLEDAIAINNEFHFFSEHSKGTAEKLRAEKEFGREVLRDNAKPLPHNRAASPPLPPILSASLCVPRKIEIVKAEGDMLPFALPVSLSITPELLLAAADPPTPISLLANLNRAAGKQLIGFAPMWVGSLVSQEWNFDCTGSVFLCLEIEGMDGGISTHIKAWQAMAERFFALNSFTITASVKDRRDGSKGSSSTLNALDSN